MDWIFFLNEVVFTFIEGLVILVAYTSVLGRKGFLVKDMGKSLAFLVMYTGMSYWATHFIPMGIHTVIHVLFSIGILSILIRTNIYASFVSFLIVLAILFVMETVLVLLLLTALGMNMNGLQDPGTRLVAMMIVKPLELLAALLLTRVRLNFLGGEIFKRENTFSVIGIFQIFMFIVSIVSIIYISSHPDNLKNYQISMLIIFTFLICLNYVDYRERERMLRQKQKFEVQEGYVKNLEASIHIIRKERHEYANHLNTLLAMCVMNKENTVATMKAYMEKLAHNMKSSYQVFNSGNEYVDGLLAVKSSYANENNISLDTNFVNSLSLLSLPGNDLVSILGNLIDNAIDALRTEPDKTGRYIFISSRMQGDRLELSVSNNGPEIPEKFRDQIFHNGFTTKTDKNEHGFGLYIIRQLVEKNGGTVSLRTSASETTFSVIFPAIRAVQESIA